MKLNNLKGKKVNKVHIKRAELGYTHTALGLIVGCTGTMICEVESGRRNASLLLKKKIALALKTKVDEIF